MIKRHLKLAGVCVFSALSVVLVGILIVGGAKIFEDNVQASHVGNFPANAEWVQPTDPHPLGWDCWLLGDSDLDLNAPYLIWCDTQN